jgi:hypothetical protein
MCLQFGHSNVECTQRCALCQARTYTTATCEYNLLARKNSPAVQAIEPVQQQAAFWGNNRFNRGRGRRFNCRFERAPNNNEQYQFREDRPTQQEERGQARNNNGGRRRWDNHRRGKELLCFRCCQPDHFAVNCPHPPPGPPANQGEASTSANPSVNLITPAVQLVTTRSRTRAEQWTEQDNARDQARQWVEAANANQDAEVWA